MEDSFSEELPWTYRPTTRGVAAAVPLTGVVGTAMAVNFGLLYPTASPKLAVAVGFVGLLFIATGVLIVRTRTVCASDGLSVTSGLSTRTFQWSRIVDLRAELLPGSGSTVAHKVAVAYVWTDGEVELHGLPGVNERLLGGREVLEVEITRIRSVWHLQRGRDWAGAGIDMGTARAGVADRFMRRQQRVQRRTLPVMSLVLIAFLALLIAV